MLLGFRNRSLPREMSEEEFLETFGRPQRTSSGPDIIQDSDEYQPTSRNSSSTVRDIQNSKSEDSLKNLFDSASSGTPFSVSRKKNMNVVSQFSLSLDSRRRSSKLHHVASKLSRKSLRTTRKKGETPQTPYSTEGLSGNKWNSFMFKRSRSSSKCKSEADGVSSDTISSEDERKKKHSVTSTTSDGFRSFKRSISYQTLTSSNPASYATKRTSFNAEENDSNRRSIHEFHGVKMEILKPFSTVTCRKSATWSTFLPISSAPCDSQHASPENDVIKKFDDIRGEEESRQVAVVTLLKRRRNSIKIKCDQFEKELSQKKLDYSKAKIIRARLSQMKRKMEIANQCIEEQIEGMKVTDAKVNLILSLELYKLNLMQEEKQGYSDSKRLRGQNSNSSISASCDTLLSADDTCVFDDAASMTSSKKADSTNSSPTHHSRRYRAFCSSVNSHSHAHMTSYLADELVKEKPNSYRSHSVDNTVTSDCDSGFDNGDGLSRSDVSLNRSFSKSTGSITSRSGLSHVIHPRSVSCQESTCSSVLTNGNYFFSERSHASSETSVFGEKQSNRRKFSSSSKLGVSRTVDPSVLAAIEDFEKFADKTRRRLSLNGKLIPLKKGT